MTIVLLALVLSSLPAAGACPAEATAAAGPGLADPFHVPLPAAAQLNADGKVLYRQERWEQARQKYRAAIEIDPEFLAPALNVACSFVREERLTEAMDEVLRLLDRGYLPWSQEILSAADLGALKVGNEGRRLRAALESARLRWAEDLSADLILIARLRAPLRLAQPARAGGGQGAVAVERALVLGLRQEVFAWSPRTRRYRQLTTEEGRVLAVARSRDGRRIAYLTAEKLILSGSERPTAFRGAAVTELDLEALTPLGRGRIPGDVRRLEIIAETAAGPRGGFAYRLTGAASPPATFVLRDGALHPRGPGGVPRAAVTLELDGVAAAERPVPLGTGGACAATARDVRSPGGVAPFVLVTGSGAAAPFKLVLGGPHGAGLLGLPIR